MRQLSFILLILTVAFQPKAQQANCTLKDPAITIHFGEGIVSDQNTMVPARYTRVSHYCPSDGYYTYTPSTSRCFRDDWFTVSEDHTSGDGKGNMLIVNSSPGSGMFFRTAVNGLKSGTNYEFSVWLMNVCKITEKCPFPLLPDITISLQTGTGKNVAQLETGEVLRHKAPQWTQYRFMFTTPKTDGSLNLTMINNAPGGCGNDFALDDITFRECVPVPPVTSKPKRSVPVAKKQATTKPVAKKSPATRKPAVTTQKKVATKPIAKRPSTKPLEKKQQKLDVVKIKPDSIRPATATIKQRTFSFPPPPPPLRTRTNAIVKQIMVEAGEIRVDLYDNGEIDNDTVSIYHNNKLLASKARLSQQPVTFRISVNEGHPHHELVMVAENLGSIPPNTSLMIVSSGNTRQEVFISSTKQKNAKVVLELKN